MALSGEPTIAQVEQAAATALAIWRSELDDQPEQQRAMLDLLAERLPRHFTRSEILAADQRAVGHFDYPREFACHLLGLNGHNPPPDGDTTRF